MKDGKSYNPIAFLNSSNDYGSDTIHSNLINSVHMLLKVVAYSAGSLFSYEQSNASAEMGYSCFQKRLQLCPLFDEQG